MRYTQLLGAAEKHPIKKVGARLRAMMLGAQKYKSTPALPPAAREHRRDRRSFRLLPVTVA